MTNTGATPNSGRSPEEIEQLREEAKQKYRLAKEENERRCEFWTNAGFVKRGADINQVQVPNFITVDARDPDFGRVLTWVTRHSVPARLENKVQFPYIEILDTPEILACFKAEFGDF